MTKLQCWNLGHRSGPIREVCRTDHAPAAWSRTSSVPGSWEWRSPDVLTDSVDRTRRWPRDIIFQIKWCTALCTLCKLQLVVHMSTSSVIAYFSAGFVYCRTVDIFVLFFLNPELLTGWVDDSMSDDDETYCSSTYCSNMFHRRRTRSRPVRRSELFCY